jgi:ADP-heptose:LPS heptosyltransferase
MAFPGRPVAVVLRALNLGDLLVAVPALRGLRRALPEHRVLLATRLPLAELAMRTGAVDAVVAAGVGTDGADALLDVPAEPDVAVNLHGSGPQSHRALDACRPRRRIGYGRPELPGWTGPSPAEIAARAEHERDRWCALLAAHGIAADPTDLRLPPPASSAPHTRVTIVHPGAAFGSKRWPAQRFAAVARALAADGFVVVTGSAAEIELAREVAAGAGLPADRVLAGSTTIGGLAALVARADLVVSGDTGIAHLASAFATPSVVLFGPVSPRRWGPPPGPHVALTDERLRRGDAFADTPDPALLAVDVEQVLDAVAAVRSPAVPAAG